MAILYRGNLNNNQEMKELNSNLQEWRFDSLPLQVPQMRVSAFV